MVKCFKKPNVFEKKNTISLCVNVRLLLVTYLGATALTRTSLRLEPLYGTSIWTIEIRFSSTYAAHEFIMLSASHSHS